MLKKILTIGVSLVILSTGIVGCGPKTTGSQDEKLKKEPLVTLKYYTVGESPKDLELVESEINKYLEEKINVNIDLQFIGFGDYDQKTSIMVNSGEDFDLMFTSSWAGDYIGNSRKGAFLNLTPYLDSIGKDMYEAIDYRFWDATAIEGKNFAVPNQKELGVMPVWKFTKEYVDKYDIPYQEIKTIQDLEPWLKIIKENEPAVFPMHISKGGYAPPRYIDYIIEPIGVEFGDKTLTVKNVFETERMIEQIKTIRKYYQAGYINEDSATARGNNKIKVFVSNDDSQPYAEEIWKKDLGYEVVLSPIMESLATSRSTTGSMVAVNANSKNPEKAIQFLNLLNTDPYVRNLITYGVEGVHYDKVEGKENTIKLNPLTYKDYDVAYYTLGNLFITYVLDGEPETKWEEFQSFNNEVRSSEILGFRLDTSKIVNEISAINNVIDEFQHILYSGSVDSVKYLKEFNKKLYAQGLQKVIDEAQKQLDEWAITKQ